MYDPKHILVSQFGIFSLLAFLMVVPALPVLASDRGEVYRHSKAATAVIIGLQDDERSVSIGSGFFVTEDGILVTNAHILEDADRILVYVENQAIFANPKVLIIDPDADLAALQLQSTKVTALQLAQNAPDEATQVIAVGYPRLIDVLNMGFALHSTIAPGTINGHANGRTRIEGRHATFLQITGTLNAGNSGGPLVDIDSGEVVGMVTQTVPYLERAKDKNGAVVASVTIRSGIGYAIPATRIRQWLVERRLLSLDQLSRPTGPVAVVKRNDDPVAVSNQSFATAHLMHTLAMVLSQDTDFLELAASHYDAALAFRPGAVRILCDLGMTYLLLGKKDKAIEKFAAALKSDPTSATAAYHLGLAFEAQGQKHDALTTWEEFLTKRATISDQDEWSTNMREAVSRVKVATTNLAHRESE